MTADAADAPATPASPPPTAPAPAPPVAPRASVRWGGYVVVMAALLGLGYAFTKSWLWPKFIMPAWMWKTLSGWHSAACYAIAVALASGMTADAADMLLVRSHRRLARLTILLMIVALAFLAVWAWRHQHRLVAIVAALMATVGPLARRALPGLPRAQVRRRRPT